MLSAMAFEPTVMKQIIETHAPDGRDFYVEPILYFIDEILLRLDVPGFVNGTRARLTANEEDTIWFPEFLSYTICKISSKMSSNCFGGEDVSETTVSIFKMLDIYPWGVKLVLAFAAFAVNYGEFWMVAQLDLNNPLAQSVAFLKNLSETIECADLKPEFDALGKLINAMVDITKCIVEFQNLPDRYILPDTPALKVAWLHIPDAVYWTIRCMMACGSQIVGLIAKGNDYIKSTVEASELLKLTAYVCSKNNMLQKQLVLCNQLIDVEKFTEKYAMTVRIFESLGIDNIRPLRTLIYSDNDIQPLCDGYGKNRVSIDVLRSQWVLLLISELEFSHKELSPVVKMYNEAWQNPSLQLSQYYIVWLPVVDRSIPWDTEKEKKFADAQATLPFYSICHPSLLHPAVIKYIKEVWKFNKKSLIVTLDPLGRLVNTNAFHMIWIWGNRAFPFTTEREKSLWKNEIWRIEFLLDSIDPRITTWVAGGKYVCLYGGKDIEWIREFTTTARTVAEAAQIPLEMIYVGKSNPKEAIQTIIETITAKKLSHTLPDLTTIWSFWGRIESMFYSKCQNGMSVENDQIIQEILTLLSYDGSEQGWGIMCKNSTEMSKANGDRFLNSLREFDSWKENVSKKGFIEALNDDIIELKYPTLIHSVNRLLLPTTTGIIPEAVVCSECGTRMEKVAVYRCMNNCN